MMQSEVLTKTGTEKIKAYSVDEVKLPMIKFYDLQRNHKIVKYSTTFATLDTETSHSGDIYGWVYQWAFKIGKTYVYGRKPSELVELFRTLAERYELNENKRIIVYIHNASYDLQYLKWYIRDYDPTARYFAIDAHTILICDLMGIRILCSYKLTNLSLDALSKNYSRKYVKASGAIDYSVTRYQDTELTNIDWHYMFSDVAAQADGVTQFLRSNGYTRAADAPVTSTGFVRVDCRKAARDSDRWRDEFLKMKLTPEQYALCRQAFMGGMTIASYRYAGDTIRDRDIGHVDFTSSYPARQCLDYFPIGAPEEYGDIEDREELDDLLNAKCCVFIFVAEHVQIKAGVTAPYIPSSKLIASRNVTKINGKVVYAEYLEMAVTEIDFKIIQKQYDAENISVKNMLTFTRGKLPEWLRNKVIEYFRDKCTLKGIDELLYMKQKNRLNGIYGMTATAIVRELFEMGDDLILGKAVDADSAEENAASQIKKFYDNYNSFLPYQWALYTTAHARAALVELIEVIGYENFLYCDTDSEFFIITDENKKRFGFYKQKLIDRARAEGAFCGDKFLGAAEDEPKIRAFRALHAKCYATEEWDEKKKDYVLKVVVAGIPKNSTKWIDGKPVTISNAEELGNIDNLDDGFVFKHNGGTRTIYNEQMPETLNIDGHETEIASSVIICDIEKEINDTMYTRGEDYTMLHIAQETM